MNRPDTRPVSHKPRPDPRVLLTRLATLGTLGFALVALVRPAALSGEQDGRYYPAMYAARAIPLGLGVLLAPSPALFRVAAAAQAGDALLGLVRRNPGQTLAPALLATLYAAQAHQAPTH